MSTEGYVLAMGPVCIDEYYSADKWVSEGSKLFLQTGESVVGGMIPNAACIFSSLGVPTKFFDRINSGALSQRLLKDLQSYGLDTSPVLFDDSIADSKCIIVQTPTDRTILIVSAEKPKVRVTGSLLQVFRNAAYIYTTPHDMTQLLEPAALIEDVKAHGAKLVFDVEESNTGENFKKLIPMADILFFNEFGFSAYCGGNPEEECIKALFDAGVEIITITLGKHGSHTITKDDEARNPAYDFPVVDPTGAGDTYNSAFIRCIMEGRDIHYAARFANMAASYAVSGQGPKSGAKSAAFVEDLLAKHGDKTAR